MKKVVIALVLALGVSGCAASFTDPDDTLRSDYVGGSIKATFERIQAHKGRVILDGHYFSASTMWLGHPAACVLPQAKFVTHQPYNGITSLPLSPEKHRLAVALMAAMYPEPLKSRFLEMFPEPRVGASHKRLRVTGAEILAVDPDLHCDNQLLAVLEGGS